MKISNIIVIYKIILYIIGIVVINPLNVNCQIVYTDVTPDVVVYGYYTSGLGSYSFDINDDGTNDFKLTHMDFVLPNAEADIYSTNTSNSEVLGEVNPTDFDIVYALEQNSLIDSLQTTWLSPDAYQYLGKLYSNGSAPWQWGSATDKYLGIRIMIGNQWHYGWVRINVPSNGGNITLKDYAYESMAGQSILAGEVESTKICSVSRTSDFSVFSEDKILHISFTSNNLLGGKITVFNVLGKKMRSYIINGDNIKINLSNVCPGIYIMNIQNENFNWSKKIYLTK